jgi:hypothetical protein
VRRRVVRKDRDLDHVTRITAPAARPLGSRNNQTQGPIIIELLARRLTARPGSSRRSGNFKELDMPNPVLRVSPVGVVNAASTAGVELSHLIKSNPKLPALIAQFPGLKAFLVRHTSSGAIASSATGTASPVKWSAWFHSPASLHQDYNWQDQLIFVFQRGPAERGKIDFGSEGSYQGRLIGVHRLGDLDVFTRKVGGFTGGESTDFGFEALMPVEAIGKPGDKLEVCFCIGSLDDKGNPTGGWGTLGGYGGRQHDIVVGKPAEAPIHEDGGGYTVLIPKPGGGYISKRVP